MPVSPRKVIRPPMSQFHQANFDLLDHRAEIFYLSHELGGTPIVKNGRSNDPRLQELFDSWRKRKLWQFGRINEIKSWP